MSKICSFFGHSDYCETDELVCKIKSEIIDSIKNKKIDTFYLGGKGNFDYACAKYIKSIKKNYPHIKSYLILLYLNTKTEKYNKKHIEKMFDGTIFPPIENVPFRFAMSKRNEWIVSNSNYIIFYINHSWGGACNSLEYANKKHKNYKNFGTKNSVACSTINITDFKN